MRNNEFISVIQNLPKYYHDIREIRELCDSMSVEFKQFALENELDLKDFFVLSASEDALTQWEEEIYIKYNKFVDALQFRRDRLINRYTTRPPFTIKWLEIQLKNFLGVNFKSVKRDNDVEMLIIDASFDGYNKYEEIITMLEMSVPLSMLWAFIFTSYRLEIAPLYFGIATCTLFTLTANPI